MDQPNIILIVLDTLRKDVLPMYGGNAYTPNLNEFANDAVVFPNPIAPAPWTLPSHVSFFSGLYPSEHKVHEYFNESKKDFETASYYDGKTIVETLKNKGYNTLGFTANGVINPNTGLTKSFNYFKIIPWDYFLEEDVNFAIKFFEKEKIKKINFKNIINNYRDIPELYKRYKSNKYLKLIYNYPMTKGANLIIEDLFTKNNISFNSPFFLFLNFMEMHEPYVKWELLKYRLPFYKNMEFVFDLAYNSIPSKIMNQIREMYLKNLANLDFYLGKIIKFLKELKQYENTMIIITSDHGQALKEKNYYSHGLFLYNEIIEVPLIIKFPNNKKIELKNEYQSLVDIPNLIENVSEGNLIDISNEFVFSESYGFHVPLFKIINNDKISENLKNKYGIPRKAIYKKGYKLVVNKFGNIEEFLYKGKEIKPEDNKEVLDDLLDELDIFKGTEKFVVRKNN
jgi:arylsulfatase A-like enzyme